MRGLVISLPALRLVLLVCSLKRHDLCLQFINPVGSPFQGLPLLRLELFGIGDPGNQVRPEVVARKRSEVTCSHFLTAVRFCISRLLIHLIGMPAYSGVTVTRFDHHRHSLAAWIASRFVRQISSYSQRPCCLTTYATGLAITCAEERDLEQADARCRTWCFP